MTPPRSAALAAVLVIAGATALGGALRFYHLSSPDEKVFDEYYYASDGCWYAGNDYRRCGLDDDTEIAWVHPPLGKQLIAWGIDGFGNRSFGWRVSAAAAGTATVGLTGILAFLLFGRVLWAGVASLLLATESLHFVQSRVAMLDVFLAFFVTLGFLLLVWDRSRARARPWAALWRPLRLLAGAAFGAAIAVKWSGLLALLGAVILAVAWETSRRTEADDPNVLPGFWTEMGGVAIAFVAVPLVTYWVSWLPWFVRYGFGPAAWFGHHVDMANYHLTLQTVKPSGKPIHPYLSPAWTWFLLARPVSYYWRGETSAEILGIGNPLVFWGALLYVPWLGWSWARDRDWRAGAILVPILAQYVPWLFASRPLFLFYMTPVTPFLALGLTYAARDLASVRVRWRLTEPAAAAIVAAAVGLFAFFWPVLVGDGVGNHAWHARMWFDSWI